MWVTGELDYPWLENLFSKNMFFFIRGKIELNALKTSELLI